MSYILGVSGYFHDSSVCLLRDGQLIEFVKEESLTRIKGTRGFPSRSLNFLIKNIILPIIILIISLFMKSHYEVGQLIFISHLQNLKFLLTC